MKFVRPLYRELRDGGAASNALAIKTFRAHRSMYHRYVYPSLISMNLQHSLLTMHNHEKPPLTSQYFYAFLLFSIAQKMVARDLGIDDDEKKTAVVGVS
jgi:hypothetical protein